MNLPLPGNAPLQYATPIEGYKIPPILTTTADSQKDSQKQPRWVNSLTRNHVIPQSSHFRVNKNKTRCNANAIINGQSLQYFGAPIAYVQQIVVKSVVSPWEPNRLIPADAFRAPLSQVFDVVENINNFYYKEG